MMARRGHDKRVLVAVLIKDFAGAKSRLRGTLQPKARMQLARTTAVRALEAARAAGSVVAVCGSAAAAAVATASGAYPIIERDPRGQNVAGDAAIVHATAQGASEVLLLSSDLPLVDADAIQAMIDRAAAVDGPLVLAAAALGRQGTNALYLRPPDVIALQFGDASLPRFAAEAARRGCAFVVHDDVRLALDIDEPGDLATLRRLQGAA
jgi:2-phospho-L-lactate guanylyltransferase